MAPVSMSRVGYLTTGGLLGRRGTKMAICEFMDECSFFSEEVGYSPELWEEMKLVYCHGNWSSCARLEAAALLPVGTVPKDLMPSEHDRVRILAKAGEEGLLPPAAPGSRIL
jgi:hypothetical protein